MIEPQPSTTASGQQTGSSGTWYYEDHGKRNGPVSAEDLSALIKQTKIGYGDLVWAPGLADWQKLEDTEWRDALPGPPPLKGGRVPGLFVWLLAFAPLIGLVLEALVAGIVYEGDEAAIATAMSDSKFFYITLLLNILFAGLDSHKLKRAGYDTSKFGWWFLILVPVYIYLRSKHLKVSYAPFIVWMIAFLLLLLASASPS